MLEDDEEEFIDEFSDAGKDQVGGKAYCLAEISSHGIPVPKT